MSLLVTGERATELLQAPDGAFETIENGREVATILRAEQLGREGNCLDRRIRVIAQAQKGPRQFRVCRCLGLHAQQVPFDSKTAAAVDEEHAGEQRVNQDEPWFPHREPALNLRIEEIE